MNCYVLRRKLYVQYICMLKKANHRGSYWKCPTYFSCRLIRVQHLLPPQLSSERRHGSILEYQVMPSLRDVAHDGLLCTFTYISAAGNSIRSQLGIAPIRSTGTVLKRQAVRPVHHVQNYTCRVTLPQPARRAAVLDRPSILRPHWLSRSVQHADATPALRLFFALLRR